MAYLKRLELHGFKSFAHRSALEFSPGITAIVGPNGSGKSNLADSIRWVLGEQSMRQLRGKKSDDVIFAGGPGRAAAQMAQVGLVLDNSAAWIPSDYAEVTVARRSFRSGESEYLSNGQRVRLRDVLLLLAQARIGHDSYTVIGQGQIDQALSLRAEERRALFEDAAGIRQFQAQRTEAEQKLTLTQSNLARLHDILGEIEPRLVPLAEQARRASEFTNAREELLRLLRIWYRRQWRDLGEARDRAEAAERDFAARIETLQQALEAAGAGANIIRIERETLLTEIGALRRERGETSGQLQTTERDLAVGRERLASLNRQQTDLDAEREEQTEAVVVARAHIGALEAQIANAEEQAEIAAASVEKLERGQHAARQEQEREEARLRAAQREVMQAQARLAAAQTELGRLQRQVEDRNRSLAARREAVTRAQETASKAEQQLAIERDAFELARSQVEDVVARREQLAQQISDGQSEIERLRMATADAERERRARADRLALLDEWQRSLSGFSDGARALLQAAEDEHPAPLLGVVGRLASAPEGLEAALEAAFGEALHALVVASRQDALNAAAWLRTGGHGKAMLVWSGGALGVGSEATYSLAYSPQNGHATLPAADGKELFGLAREALNCGEAERPALARLLGETLIVRDLAVAERLWGADGPPVPIVTLTGEALHPQGWLRGGASVVEGADRQPEESTLARERELRLLPDELERRAAEIADLRGQLDAATTAQSERRAQDDALKREAQELEAAAQERAKVVAALQREQERAQSEAQLSEAVLAQLATEAEGIETELSATLAQAKELERAHRDAAERVDDAQAEVDDLALRNRAQLEDLTRARTSLALRQQEVKTLGQRADQVRAQTREVEAQLARRNERLRFIQAQHEELETAIATQEGEIADLRERVRLLGDGLREREGRQLELERQLAEYERSQGAEREELARLEVEYRRSIVESQRARDAVEALAVQVREELGAEDEADPFVALLGIQPDGGRAPHAPTGNDSLSAAGVSGGRPRGAESDTDMPDADLSLSADELAKMRRQIDALRSRLKHLGGYDPDAPQAYEELKTRHDFLTGQVKDMTDASINLRAIIAELDVTMRRQFIETFHAVNERFQRHFTALFNGGAARLELTAPRRAPGDADDDEDSDETAAALGAATLKRPSLGGVEVFVQIPGKRVQDLSLLSGGERAMVSAALLFALLETNPPPFCLLDEVDAALDEANVVRFCDILKALAERTQFIVITHNRVTMTHADAIYGVSMGPDSVSRVLSMRLSEVKVGTRER